LDWLSTSGNIPPELEVPPSKPAIDCMVEKCIALTFDDGPGAYTEELLNILKDRDVDATFFVLGSLAEAHPKTVKRMEDEGHEVGNHSWKHTLLTRLGAEAAAEDIHRANEAIAKIIGHQPDVMRPPYGGTNDSIINAVGMPEIIWDIDPNDWKYQSTSNLENHIITHAHRGAIALMHDIYKSTVNAIPRIIDTLRSQGYRFVTIKELFGSIPPTGKYRTQDDYKR
jgi:peptidoglycan/xylan/chitin deacetylase (PgdA/CDA1 family)